MSHKSDKLTISFQPQSEGGGKECDVCVEKAGRPVKQETAAANNSFVDRAGGFSQVHMS